MSIAWPSRRVILAFHRVTGLAVLLFIVVVGLTGSLLVYRDNIDSFLRPGLYTIAIPGNNVGVDTAVRAALVADPHATLVGSEIAHSSANPRYDTYTVFVAHGSDQDSVVIDPSTGKVNGILRPHQRFTDWIYELHTALLLGAFGRNVVGIVGVVTTFVAFAGILLWPGWKNIRAGFTYKRGASTRRKNYDFHKLTGLAAFAFLVFLAASGSMMTWGASVNAALSATAHTPFDAPTVAKRSGATLLTLGKLSAIADQIDPGSFSTYVAKPTPTQSVYVARAGHADFDQTFGFRTLYLNPYTGMLLRKTGGPENPLPNWYSFVYALHIGNFYMHPAYRILILVAGMSPLVLAISGSIVLFLKSRRRIAFKTSASPRTSLMVRKATP